MARVYEVIQQEAQQKGRQEGVLITQVSRDCWAAMRGHDRGGHRNRQATFGRLKQQLETTGGGTNLPN